MYKGRSGVYTGLANSPDEQDIAINDDESKRSKVRTNFPETWLWNDYVTE